MLREGIRNTKWKRDKSQPGKARERWSHGGQTETNFMKLSKVDPKKGYQDLSIGRVTAELQS